MPEAKNLPGRPVDAWPAVAQQGVAMRTILLIGAVTIIGGCAGISGSQRNDTASSPRDIPVVSERPSIFERQRVNRQRQAEQETLGLTVVRGNLTR